MPTDRLKELASLAERDDDRDSALSSLAEPESTPAPAAAPRPRRTPRTKAGARLDGVAPDLIDFAAEQDAVVTSGTDSMGIRSRGSRHGSGDALDLRTRDKTPEQIEQMARAARARGYDVITKPHGTGPHMHVSKRRGGQAPPARPAQPDQLEDARAAELAALAEQDSDSPSSPPAGPSALPPGSIETTNASPAEAAPPGRKPGSRPTSTSPERWAEAPASASEAETDELIEQGMRVAAEGKPSPRARAVMDKSLPADLPEHLPIGLHDRVSRGDKPDTYRVVDERVEAARARAERQAAVLRRRVERQRRERAALVAQAEAINRAQAEEANAPRLSIGETRRQDNSTIEGLTRKITSKGELLAQDERRLKEAEARASRAQGGHVGEIRAEDERRARAEPQEAAKDRAYYEALPEQARRPSMGLRPGDVDFNDPAQLRAARLKHEADTARAQGEAGRIASVPYTAQLRTLAGNLVGGVAEIPASVLDTVGTLAYEIDRKAFDSKKARADYFTTELARRIRENARKDLPADPRLAGSFTFDTLPAAFGSALGFAGPGWLSKSKYVVPAFLGVTVGFSEGYNDAKQAGASDDDAFKSALLNGGMGASEILPVSTWVGRMNRATGGAFGRALKKSAAESAEEAVARALTQETGWRSMAVEIAKEMAEEGGQEAAQTAFGNFVANTLVGYDPTRATGRGVAEAALAGGIVGGGMSAVTQLAASGAPASDAPAEPVAQNLTSNAVENQATPSAEVGAVSVEGGTSKGESPAIKNPQPGSPLEELKEGARAVAVVPQGTKIPAPLRSFKDFDGNRVVYNPEMVEREEVVAAMDAGNLEKLNGELRDGRREVPVGDSSGVATTAGIRLEEQASAETASDEEEGTQPPAEVSLNGRAAKGEGAGGGPVPERGAAERGREGVDAQGVAGARPVEVAEPGHVLQGGDTAPGVSRADAGAAGSLSPAESPAPAHHSNYQPRDTGGTFTPGKPAIPAHREEAASLAKTLREKLESAGTVEEAAEADAPEVGYSYRDGKGRVLEVRKADAREVVLGPRGGEGDATVSLTPERFRQEFERTKHKFSSTQVDVPAREARAVRSLGASLIPDSALYTDAEDGTNGREETPHVTVKYGLHTEQADDVRRALAGTAPFEVALGETSIFEAKGDTPYDVVKVGVESPELHALNAKLASALKVTDTFPDYVPHVTLAYVKRGEGKKYAGDKSFAGKRLKFDKLTFSSSNGETVEIPLKGEKQNGTVNAVSERLRNDEGRAEAGIQAGDDDAQRAQTGEEAQEQKEIAESAVGKRARVGRREGVIRRAYTSTEGVEAFDILFDGKSEPTPVQRKNAQVIEPEAQEVVHSPEEAKPRREGNAIAQVGGWGGWAMNDRFLFHEDVTLAELERAAEYVREALPEADKEVGKRLLTIAREAIDEKLREMRAEPKAEEAADKPAPLIKKPKRQAGGELAGALQTIGAIKSRHLSENPNGTWSFVGSVPAELAYTTKEGGVPTDEQVGKARQFGPGIVGLKSRVWQTKEEAEQAAAEFDARHGATVPAAAPRSDAQAPAQPKARTVEDIEAEARPLVAEIIQLRAALPNLKGRKRTEARDRHSEAVQALTLLVEEVGDDFGDEAYRRLRDIRRPIHNAAPEPAAPSLADQFSPEAKAALDRLKDKFAGKLDTTKLPSATPFGNDDLIDAAIVSAEVVKLGVRKTAAWARQMVELVGDAVRPYLGRIWDATLVELDVAGEDTSELEQEYVAESVDAETEEEENALDATEGKSDDADAGQGDNAGSAQESGPGAVRTPQGGGRTGRVRRGARGGGAGGRGAGQVGADPADGAVGGVDARPGEGVQAGLPGPGREGDAGGGRDRYGFYDNSADYLAAPGSLRREGSWRETARRNLDILELVKRLEAEGRQATPEEQSLIVRFTGWGASEIANNLFPGYAQYGEIREYLAREGWGDLVKRAKALFSDPAELKTAARSTQYAHYTSEGIIRGIWGAFRQFGFTGGKIHEPGMGTGLFAVAAPSSVMRASKYTGVEMDKLTGAVAKQLLPSQNVIVGDYSRTKLPDNFFDVSIGNPPFAGFRVTDDPELGKHGFFLHDYFFAKAMNKTRPGGLLAFVTSKGTMDKLDAKSRRYLADRADLLGAIRLPQTAFKQNAGTDVVTDVLFFRKRMEGEQVRARDGGRVDLVATNERGEAVGEPVLRDLPAWLGHGEVTAPNRGGQPHTGLINEYYVNHPEMVLGTHSYAGEMRPGRRKGEDPSDPGAEYTVLAPEGDIEELFREAVGRLPAGVYAGQARAQAIVAQATERDFNPKAKKEGSVYVHEDGRLMRREHGSGVQLSEVEKLSANAEAFLRDYVSLRDALKQAQLDQLQDGPWEKSLKALNKAYDAFVKKNGRILDFTKQTRAFVVDEETGETEERVYYRFKNARLMEHDIESALVMALEKITEDDRIVKAPMLTGRTINKPKVPAVRTLSDALAVSLDQVGRLNIPHVRQLMAPVREMTDEQVVEELGDAVYEIPGGGYQLADEYLSGFVIDKLEEAEVAARSDQRFKRNVEALLKAQPAPLDPSKINVGLGAGWVPARHVQRFAEEALDLNTEVVYHPASNIWHVEGAQGAGVKARRSAVNDWGTPERSVYEIFDAALNNQTIKVMTPKTRTDPARLDETATAAANDKVKKMRDAFRRWVWTDAERADELTRLYNRQYNNIAPRAFNGSHMTLPGLSAVYKLHDHQKRAVWRILQSGNTYLAHAVGAGKTLEMIVAGMEQKRLGLVNKPMYVVPNHMLRQFSREFLEAYPLANILVADEKNFSPERRARFIAQAALNDLDAVIITHTAFGKLNSRPESAEKIAGEIIDQLRTQISELDEDDRTQARFIKQMENRIEAIERKFLGRAGKEGADTAVDFEDTGVDFLFIDEAHLFRKLDFATNRNQVKGITPQGSQRALDLLIKSRTLEDQRPGRSMVLASGTPITNTIGELYTVQKFMEPAEMERAGIGHFDAWANQYGEMNADFEMNAAGKYESVERFSRFINIPSLMKLVRQFMDVLTLRQLSELVNLPTIRGGKPEVVVVPRDADVIKYLNEELDGRIAASKAWKPSKDQPNNPDPIVRIITDGKLASIDMRFVRRNAPNNPNSKLNKMIDSIIEKYFEYQNNEYFHKEDKGRTGPADPIKGATQIVFSHLGFGEMVAKNRGFDASAWLKKRLVEAGIPASEIAFMGDYKSAAAKEQVFADMREGRKKILVGSPQNMGTGVNVQKRLKVLHFLSPPWYPADVEQPMGRIVRQGNQNEEVEAYWYATKGTYDSTAWQMISRKSRSIEDALSGNDEVFTLDDISESSLYDMASALSSGDERAIKLASLRREIEGLERLRNAHADEQYALRGERNNAHFYIDHNTKLAAKLDRVIEMRGEKSYGEAFTVGPHEKREPAGDAIKAAWLAAANKYGPGLVTATKEWAKKKEAAKNRKEADAAGEQPEHRMMLDGLEVLGKFKIGLDFGVFGSNLKGRMYLHAGPFTESIFYALTAEELQEVSSAGLVQKMQNYLNGFEKERAEAQSVIDQNTRRLKQIEAKLGRPFEGEGELLEKTAEFFQLQREMTEEGIKTNVPAPTARGDVRGPLPFIPENEEEYKQVKRRIMRQLKTLISGNTLASGAYPAHVVAEIMPDLARLGAYHLREGATTFKAFAGRMVDDLGEGIQPHLRKIYTEAKKLIEGNDERNEPAAAAADDARGTSEQGGGDAVREVSGGVSRGLREDEAGAVSNGVLEERGLDEGAPHRDDSEGAAPDRRVKRAVNPDAAAGVEEVQRRAGGAAAAQQGDGARRERSFPRTLEAAGLEGGDDRTGEPTGPKNEITERERQERGLPPVEKQLYTVMGDAYARGREAVESGSIDPRLLAEDIAERPRPLSALEVGALAFDRARLRNEYRRVSAEVAAAVDEGDAEAVDAGRRRLAQFERDFDRNDQALTRGGREQSAAFNARKLLVLEDYSLAAVLSRAKTKKGADIDAETRARLEELTRKLEHAEERLQNARNTIQGLEAERVVKHLNREKRRERREVKKEELDKEFDELSTMFGKLASRPHMAAFALDPEMVKIIGRMAKNRVLAGVNTVEGLVDAVHAALSDHFDDLDKRDVRDWISRYGETSEMSQEEADKTLRELKRRMRLVSALEDADAGSRPRKTGPVRDAETDEVRELRKQVREMMRERGIEIERAPRDEAAAWKTALDALKTRLRHEAAELERQIAAGDFSKPAKRQPLERDAEAEELEDRRDRLRYEIEREVARQERHSWLARAGLLLAELLSLPKQTMLGFDPSHLGRQVYPVALMDFGAAGASLGATGRTYLAAATPGRASKEELREVWRGIEADDEYGLAVESGLELTSPAHLDPWMVRRLKDLKRREESFQSTIPERIAETPLSEMRWLLRVPGAILKPWAKSMAATERAFVGATDAARMAAFHNLAKQMKADGVDPGTEEGRKTFRKVAQNLNRWTGRGNLDLGSFGVYVNAVFLAPRHTASRFQTVNPVSYLTSPDMKLADPRTWGYSGNRATLLAARKMGRFLALQTLVVGSLVMLGADFEWDDPDEPDFGKVRFGDDVYDVFAGLQQPVRLELRVALRAANWARGRKPVERQASAGDLAWDFAERRYSPWAGYARDAYKGETMEFDEKTGKRRKFEPVGHIFNEEGEFEPGGGVVEMFAPLSWSEVLKSFNRAGAAGAARALPDVFGIAHQNYQKRERVEVTGRAAEVLEAVQKTAYRGPDTLKIAGRERELTAAERQAIENEVRADETRRIEEMYNPKDEAGRVRLDRFETASPEERKKAVEGIRREAADKVQRRFIRAYQQAHKADIERERGERKSAERARKEELIERKEKRGAITPEEARRAVERLRGNANRP